MNCDRKFIYFCMPLENNSWFISVCRCHSTYKCSSIYLWWSPLWCFWLCLLSMVYGMMHLWMVGSKIVRKIILKNFGFIADDSWSHVFCFSPLCPIYIWTFRCLVWLDPFHELADGCRIFEVKKNSWYGFGCHTPYCIVIILVSNLLAGLG